MWRSWRRTPAWNRPSISVSWLEELAAQSDDEGQQSEQHEKAAGVVIDKGIDGPQGAAKGGLAAQGAEFLAEEVLVGSEQLLGLRPVPGEGLALAGQQCLEGGDDDLLAGQRDDKVTWLSRLAEQGRKVL